MFISQAIPPDIKKTINVPELHKRSWLYDSELDAGIIRTQINRVEQTSGDYEQFLIIYKGQRLKFAAYTKAAHSEEVDHSVPIYDINYEVTDIWVPRSLSENLAEVYSVIEKAIHAYGYLGGPEHTGVVTIKSPPISEYNLV